MAQGLSNSAACREVGINRSKTGSRWRYGRKVVDRSGREHVYPPITEERDTSGRLIADHALRLRSSGDLVVGGAWLEPKFVVRGQQAGVLVRISPGIMLR